MTSRFDRWKVLCSLLWVSVCCARCAPVQQTCVRCALPCNEAHDLKKYESVIVLVGELKETPHNVSSLYARGGCWVPGCFQRGARYSVKISPDGNEAVLEPLYDKTDLQADCEQEATSVRINGVDWTLSSKLLLLAMVCVSVFLSSG